MGASLAVIEQEIDKLSADQFQLLVERFARLAFPDRYPVIYPHGRNAAGQAVAGWPDIAGVDASGNLHLVEATRRKDWRRHFAKDLLALRQQPRPAATFVFVAWAASPKPAVIAELHSDHARSVSDTALRLIFREELCERLSEPRFDRIRTEMLKLPVPTFPLVDIRRAPIFGGHRPDAFAPTLDEYDSEQVHRPRASRVLAERLAAEGVTALEGAGATGKTVLATQLALARAAHDWPAYYLDLAGACPRSDDVVASAVAAVARIADQGLLLVIDNCHLAPYEARLIYDQWARSPRGSQLLLVGRPAGKTDDWRGTARAFDGVNLPTVRLKAGRDELHGVLARLFNRFGEPLPLVPDIVLQGWEKTFAGDLVAFSTAVVHRLRDRPHSILDLAPRDARTYVRRRYLKQLTESETNAILRVAALSAFEISATERVIHPELVDSAVREGLLEIREHEGSRAIATAHAGLAHLILAAADETGEALRAEAAAADPALGASLVQALLRTGRSSEAMRMVAAIAHDDEGLSLWLTLRHAGELPIRVHAVQRARSASDGAIDRVLSSSELPEALADTDIGTMVGILGFIQGRFPSTYARLAHALSTEPLIAKVVHCALAESNRSDLGRLVQHLPRLRVELVRTIKQDPEAIEPIRTWLLTASSKEILDAGSETVDVRRLELFIPAVMEDDDFTDRLLREGRASARLLRPSVPVFEPVRERLVAAATSPAGRALLADRARWSWEEWALVFQYGVIEDPQLAAALAPDIPWLAQQLVDQPANLARFLLAIRPFSTDIGAPALAAIDDPTLVSALADRLLNSSLIHTLSLLEAASGLPLERSLSLALREPPRATRLAKRVKPVPASWLVRLCRTPIGGPVLAFVSYSDWLQFINSGSRPARSQLATVQEALRHVGRGDLAAAFELDAG